MSSSYEKLAVTPWHEAVSMSVPRGFVLGQNFPNPFNPTTTIPFRVPFLEHLLASVKVTVYNVAGQKIRVLLQEAKAAGSYTVEWDGRNSTGYHVAGGVYFYHVQVGTEMRVGKMTLVK